MSNLVEIKSKDISIQNQIKLLESSSETLFVVDYSASMSSHVEGVCKYQHVASVLNAVCAVNILAFSTFPKKCENVSEYINISKNYSGGTILGKALELVDKEYSDIKKIIIISDGETTSEKQCYILAQQIHKKGIIIECILIGESSSGSKILQTISDIGKGKFTNIKEEKGFYNLLSQVTETYLLT